MSGARQPEDPLARRLKLRRGGLDLELEAPRSTFASEAVDPGTLLLLDGLPAGEPASFLDLGCGYGALGLAVAARFPRSRGVLVDRDLLAVEYARRNAAALGLSGLEVLPSLGYRGIPACRKPFDWVLANVPARAGERALEMFIDGGTRRLSPAGEMRIVAISPLAPAVERISARRGFGGREAARTAAHVVFAFGPGPGPLAGPGPETDAGLEVYERDTIDVALEGMREPLRLIRPTDLADEPHRLGDGIPLLWSVLPGAAPRSVLSFRSGYGLVPAVLAARWPEARVVAVDRDLLGTAFTRRNCEPRGSRVEVVESVSQAPPGRGPFDLAVGEMLPPLGGEGMLAELRAVRAALAPGGRALVLGLAKHWRELLRDRAAELGIAMRGTRGAAGVYEMRA